MKRKCQSSDLPNIHKNYIKIGLAVSEEFRYQHVIEEFYIRKIHVPTVLINPNLS